MKILKRFLSIAFFVICIINPILAQKFGCIDTEYILNKMPEYKAALKELDYFASKCSKEIEDKYIEIRRLQKSYQDDEILLTEDMKRDRLRVISEKEKEVREYNNRIFGFEGLFTQKKRELIKEPMKLVNRAIEKICDKKKLDFILDKAVDFALLYTNPKYDYSELIIEELGLN